MNLHTSMQISVVIDYYPKQLSFTVVPNKKIPNSNYKVFCSSGSQLISSSSIIPSNLPQIQNNSTVKFNLGDTTYLGVQDPDPTTKRIQDPTISEKFSNYQMRYKMGMGKRMGKKQIVKMHYDEDCNECKDSNGIIVEEKYKKKYYKKNNYMSAFYIFIVILIIVLLLMLLC